MRLDLFLNYIANTNIKMYEYPCGYHGSTWEEYQKLAEMSALFAWPEACTKMEHNEKSPNHGKLVPCYQNSYEGDDCCCGSCRSTIGHWERMPSQARMLKQMAKYFSPTRGFWRKGKGCILPRKYRSHTCLTHACEIRPEPSEGFHLWRVAMDSVAGKRLYSGDVAWVKDFVKRSVKRSKTRDEDLRGVPYNERPEKYSNCNPVKRDCTSCRLRFCNRRVC